MPTQPPEILELAQHLRTTYLTEAGRRSAVSRAYYAAMHRTKAVFGLPVMEGDSESIHKAVIRAATETGKAPGPARQEASRIASELDLLRRRRAKADYDLELDFEKVECEDWVTRAQRLVDLCDEAKSKLDAHASKLASPPAVEAPAPSSPPGGGAPMGPRPGLKRVK